MFAEGLYDDATGGNATVRKRVFHKPADYTLSNGRISALPQNFSDFLCERVGGEWFFNEVDAFFQNAVMDYCIVSVA